MIPIQFPKVANPSLKLTACTRFAHLDLKIPHLKLPALQPVSKSFRFNIARTRLMMLIPAHLSALSIEMQRLMDVAQFATTGKLADSVSPTELDQVRAKFAELFNAHTENLEQDHAAEDWSVRALETLETHTRPAEILASMPPPLCVGFDALLSSVLTGTWTAFETMCDDLWEAAVNTHPAHLANLNGTGSGQKRYKSPSGEPRIRHSKDESKSVPLDLIASHRFDVRNKMGTILRERFAFNRLSGIREAYASAFNKDYAEIDNALADMAIDTLHYMRNSIVHDAGIATADYMKMAKTLSLPLAGQGRPILLDGENVVALISPVIECSKRLLLGVEKWILDHQSKSAPPADG